MVSSLNDFMPYKGIRDFETHNERACCKTCGISNIGKAGFSKYDVRKLHTKLCYEERNHQKAWDPWAVNQVLTVKEAAVLLKTTRQQIRKMIQSGELPAVKVGREWRILEEQIQNLLTMS